MQISEGNTVLSACGQCLRVCVCWAAAVSECAVRGVRFYSAAFSRHGYLPSHSHLTPTSLPPLSHHTPGTSLLYQKANCDGWVQIALDYETQLDYGVAVTLRLP